MRKYFNKEKFATVFILLTGVIAFFTGGASTTAVRSENYITILLIPFAIALLVHILINKKLQLSIKDSFNGFSGSKSFSKENKERFKYLTLFAGLIIAYISASLLPVVPNEYTDGFALGGLLALLAPYTLGMLVYVFAKRKVLVLIKVLFVHVVIFLGVFLFYEILHSGVPLKYETVRFNGMLGWDEGKYPIYSNEWFGHFSLVFLPFSYWWYLYNKRRTRELVVVLLLLPILFYIGFYIVTHFAFSK